MSEILRKGLLHIYMGDGKGKTTAAMGLALRALGAGKKVLLFQFLKDGKSSEIDLLKAFPNIVVLDAIANTKFVFQMCEEEKAQYAIACKEKLEEIKAYIKKESYELLVLDEIIPVLNYGFIDIEEVLSFFEQRPEGLEVVCTGRDPDERLLAVADYATEMKKIKHPYDSGIPAREGIEY